jgi:hypothetical protein
MSLIPVEKNGLSVSLVDPHEIPLIRDTILRDLKIVEQNSENEVSAETVVNQCIMGDWKLWVVGFQNKYRGFAVTEDIHTEPGTWLNITHLHCKKDLGALNYLMDSLEIVAKECGFRGVKLISSVPRVGAYSRRRGYRIRFIEFVNEFEEE